MFKQPVSYTTDEVIYPGKQRKTNNKNYAGMLSHTSAASVPSSLSEGICIISTEWNDSI